MSVSGSRQLDILSLNWHQNLQDVSGVYFDSWYLDAETMIGDFSIADYAGKSLATRLLSLTPRKYSGSVQWLGFEVSWDFRKPEIRYTGDADQ